MGEFVVSQAHHEPFKTNAKQHEHYCHVSSSLRANRNIQHVQRSCGWLSMWSSDCVFSPCTGVLGHIFWVQPPRATGPRFARVIIKGSSALSFSDPMDRRQLRCTLFVSPTASTKQQQRLQMCRTTDALDRTQQCVDKVG
jgi:hypothetical protein